MESLKTPDIEKIYELKKELNQLSDQERSTLKPEKVYVQENPNKLTITLSIGNRNLILSIDQAKTLAFEIRKAANRMNNIRLEKKARKRNRKKVDGL